MRARFISSLSLETCRPNPLHSFLTGQLRMRCMQIRVPGMIMPELSHIPKSSVVLKHAVSTLVSDRLRLKDTQYGREWLILVPEALSTSLPCHCSHPETAQILSTAGVLLAFIIFLMSLLCIQDLQT